MKYLIAFGLVFLGFLLGIFFVAILSKSKMVDLSERADRNRDRANELAEQLRTKNISCLMLDFGEPVDKLRALSSSKRLSRTAEEKDLDRALS